MSKDYYKILKVSPLASAKAIKASYQRLARRYHPDKNKNNPKATQMFNDISEAYQVLSDSFKRKDFDRQIKQHKGKDSLKSSNAFSPLYDSFHNYSGGPVNSSLSSSWERVSSPSPLPRTSSIEFPFKTVFLEIKSFFNNFFITSSKNLTARLHMSLEEAAFGFNRSVVLDFFHKGKQYKKKILITIPPGTEHLQKIKVIDKSALEKQIIYVEIHYQEHPFFKKSGHNILLNRPISFTTAILGGEVEVPTLRGAVSFKLPAGVHSGHVIRLKNQGFPFQRGKGYGDMLVTIQVDIPDDLPEEDYILIKKLDASRPFCQLVSEFDVQYKSFLKKRKSLNH